VALVPHASWIIQVCLAEDADGRFSRPLIDLCSFAIRDPRKAMGAGMNVEPGSPWPTTRFPLRL
jgi:hypothetical protein